MRPASPRLLALALGTLLQNGPLPVLRADGDATGALLVRVLERSGDGAIVPFPAFARALHVFADYRVALPARDLARETIDGLGAAGPSRSVWSLTDSPKLLC